ncbi:MAG: hypothetical protein P8N97_00730 [Alphaproteobacteria bacterium]|jgi:uncharacterized protein|nr:hypothetical protein [Alphaproteobacteria bacterium]
MSKKQFDQVHMNKLKNYVYALKDSEEKYPFYISRGIEDRMFAHETEARELHDCKSKKIREIMDEGKEIEYFILKHGLSEDEAILVESTMIDYAKFFHTTLTNENNGDDSDSSGLMTLDEFYSRNPIETLKNIPEGFVVININNRYKRNCSQDEIYEFANESWKIAKDRIGDLSNPHIKYVLAEYKQSIVGVFAVESWYECPDSNGKMRYGFNRKMNLDNNIKVQFINKRFPKKGGQANPIAYSICD